MKYKRIFLLVLDSLGVGQASDANKYKDEGANTLGHIKEKCGLFAPNLKKLGLLSTITMEEQQDVEAYYTIAKPNNIGKDTLNGHYEMVGIKNEKEFKSFSEEGIPIELIKGIEQMTKRKVIGNKAVNSNEIINELGEEEMKEGSFIVYTSFDSNLQIAAHEDVIPVNILYKVCEAVRKVTAMKDEWMVSRVIARPFTGKPGRFRRTNDRKDFALKPPKKSVLDSLKEKGYQVISIGKIDEIFDGEGISKKIKATTNLEVVNKLTDIMDKNFTGLCFANLNEFDYQGHLRNIEEEEKLLEDLDVEIPMILNKLNMDDLLIITADHGNDPTFEGFSHTRENVPVLMYCRNFKEPKRLEPLETLGDIAASIAENFELESPEIGESFLNKLK